MIGIEYMITAKLYETLPQEERRLWHSHVHEVKSGMLIMPQSILPEAAWEAAELKEMEQVSPITTTSSCPPTRADNISRWLGCMEKYTTCGKPTAGTRSRWESRSL